MGDRREWARLCLMGLALFVVIAPVRAQYAKPEEEYKKLIHVSEDIQPLGEHPFGANISLYNGGLSFQQTDVSEAGNGLPLKLVRGFKIKGRDYNDTSGENGAFGDWDLVVPHLETLAAWNMRSTNGLGPVNGWDVGAAGSSQELDQRCTYFSPPPRVINPVEMQSPDMQMWGPSGWWQGYHLIIPGHGSQDMLANTGANQSTYRAVTKSHWRFKCLSTIANPGSDPDTNGDGTVDHDDLPMPTGQGFLGIAPDGTKYWFDELVYHRATGRSRADPGSVASVAGDKQKLRKTLAALVGLLSGSSKAKAEIMPTGSSTIARVEAVLLVTKIEDRFGHTLTYSYDNYGDLKSITASDGRQLTVQYASDNPLLIHSITLQPSSGAPRIWTYGYDNYYHLISVTLPNGKKWQYNLTAFDFVDTAVGPYGSCAKLAADGQTQVSSTGSMTHPSGLKGTFTIKPMRHGRWNVHSGCVGWLNNDPTTSNSHVVTPYAWYSFTTTKKTFSGAGIPTETWLFDYKPATQTFANEYCGDSCSSVTTWTDVKRPDGSVVRRVFNNDYSSPFQSKLLRTDYYSGAVGSTLLRSIVNVYASPDTAPFQAVGAMMQANVNRDQMRCYTPLKQRTIWQWGAAAGATTAAVQPPPTGGGGGGDGSDGGDTTPPPSTTPPQYSPSTCAAATAGGGPVAPPRGGGTAYTWQAESFNQYAQVTKTKRFSSITGQKQIETQTAYRNDTTHWVLGLPLKVVNLNTNEVVRQNYYNDTTDLLTSRSRFGQKVMSYTWNGGQLASFTDADGHTTTLDDYKFGIPQTIGYADNTSQHLIVNDFGEITSITNQAGNTTQYSYDAAGRLTKITYPGSGWYPKYFSYTFVTGSERGIPGGHWTRTVTQGAGSHQARQSTYYDALLRPILTDTYITGVGSSNHNVRTTYNWRGQPTYVSTVRPDWVSIDSITGAGTTKTYDALGRVTTVSKLSEPDPQTGATTVLTTTSAYLSGARKQVTDPEGHITTTSYQVFDQPNYKKAIKVMAPEDITQTIARDLFGNPTKITQSGPDGLSGAGTVSLTKNLYYDAQHRLCRTQEPETGSTVLNYDAAGNLVWSAEGQVISGSGCARSGVIDTSKTTRLYDAMNRLTAVEYPDHHGDTTTTYDKLGHVETATASTANGTIKWNYLYDDLGHLTQETLTVEGYVWPIHYTYDSYGHVSVLTYPDGKKVAYAPDALGQATKIGPFATGISYFPDGTLHHFTYMGGQSDYLAERNPRHLLKNLTVGNGTAFVYSEDFAYDKDANIIGMTDLTTDGERNKTLSYDALNRLTKAQASDMWGTETYTYDALNNIRKLVSSGLVHTYYYDDNSRPTTIQNGSTVLHHFAYDAQGDITQKDDQGRIFDDAHRLLQIPGVGTYAYDAAGRRVVKTDASGNKTYYLYNRAGHLLYQWDASTEDATDYVYLGKKLVTEVHRPKGASVLNVPGVSVGGTPSDGSYTVSWSSTEYATYTVQEQINGGNWHAIYSGSATSKAESGKIGGNYRYRAQVCEAYCSDWGYSAKVGVAPTLPSITIPQSVQSGRYTVSWTRPVSTTQFDVQEQINGGTWQALQSGMTATSISLPGNTDGAYAYRVRAHNDYGTRGWATSGTVTVLHPPASAPDFPDPGTIDGDGSYSVSWGSASGASRYELQEQAAGKDWSTIYSGSSRSKAISGKGNGTWSYHVRACNAGGCGPWSSTQNMVVLHPPVMPSSISVPSSSSGSFTVSWSSSSTASNYILRQSISGAGYTTAYSGSSRSKAIHATTTGSYRYAVKACNAGGCSGYRYSGYVAVTIPPATAPSLGAPSIDSNGAYTVSWGSVSGASSYKLQQQVNGGSWSTVYSGSQRSKALSGKTNGDDYGYRVQACNAGGCGPQSATATVKVIFPPSAPTSAHQSVSGSYKLISDYLIWDAVSHATYYQVKLDSGSAIVYSGSDTSYRIASARPPDPLAFHTAHLRACNQGGCSAWVTIPPHPPATPTLSGPTSNTTGSYTISWNQEQTASTYVLQSRSSSTGWHVVYRGTNLSRYVTGKANGTYSYMAQACAATECSNWSTVLSVTVLHPPAAPASVTAPATSSGSMSVSWEASSTASSYTLQVSINSGSWHTVYQGASTHDAYTVLASGSYRYRVHACNASGCSGYSNSRTVSVILPPSVPTLDVPSSNHTGSYTVAWSRLDTATSYTLEQRVNGGSWSVSYSGSGTHKSYSGRTNGATYGYRVRGCNAGGCGSWSGTKSVDVEIPPAAPSGVSIESMGSYKLVKVYVIWNGVSGATRYEVKLGSLDGSTVYSGTDTRYLVGTSRPPDLPPYVGTAYVRSCNSHGCSAWTEGHRQ